MGRRSLKVRFTSTVAVAYILLSVGALVVFSLVTGRIVRSLGTRFAARQALLERSKLMSAVTHDLSLSMQMAQSPLLNRWAQDESNGDIRELALEELESYRRSYRGKSLFFACDRTRHYYFLDGQPGPDGSRPRYTLSPSNPNDDWYFRTIGSNDGHELNVNYDNQLGVTKVWFNVSIGAAPGVRRGVCGGGLDITSFIDEILDSGEPGVNTILIGTGGEIEGHRDRRFVIRNSRTRGAEKKTSIYDLMPDDEDRAALKQALLSLAEGRRDVETLYLTVEGRRRLAAASYLKEIKWHNVVLVDPSHVVSYRDFIPILVVTALSLLAITVIVGVLLHRLVLTPLSYLVHSSGQMAEGKFSVTMPVTSDDEIGHLTRSFNEMSRMVKDYTENLEQKVAARTEELDAANRDLEETHHQFMESIRAAERIQASILPRSDALARCTRDFQVIYRPRDLVGGDFYCIRECGQHYIIAVIDCVGHGVPGAFMTMTTSALLDRVLDTVGATSPSAILRELDRLIRDALRSEGGAPPASGSLDIGLCCCDAGSDRVRFAGARVDLHHVADGTLMTIAGSRRPIGYGRTYTEPAYEEHVVTLSDAAMLYIASDGILDQPGGPKGMALGRQRLAALLSSLSVHPAAARGPLLERALADYQGDAPQRDDITIVGFRPRGPRVERDIEDGSGEPV